MSDGRVRRSGGGRKPITEAEPQISEEIEKLIDPLTRGYPESPLRWTCKSTKNIADCLRKKGINVGERKVAGLLHEMGYSLQANKKTQEGKQHPDRNKQFEYINGKAGKFQRCGNPVISVDAKKKEIIGNFANKGREWNPAGKPE